MTNDEKILFSCVEESRKHNPQNRCSHAAYLLTDKNTYLGLNKRKSHPLQKRFGDNPKAIYLHAEIDAIRQAYSQEGNISGSELYVARTRADGSIGMSAPCEACEEAIHHFGIDQVFFTTNNGIGEMYV